MPWMVDQLEEMHLGKHLLGEMLHPNVVENTNQHHTHRSNGYLQVNPGLESSGFAEDKCNSPISAAGTGLDWNNASMRNTHAELG